MATGTVVPSCLIECLLTDFETIIVAIPKPKAKRRLVIQESDPEKTHSPQLVKKARTLKSKHVAAASLPIFAATSTDDQSVAVKPTEAPIAAVPLSVVKASTAPAAASKSAKVSSPKSAKKSVAKALESSGKKSVDDSSAKSTKSVVAAPLQKVSLKTQLPLARAFGKIVNSNVEITLSGLDIKHGLSGLVDRKECHLIVADEPRPKNFIQLQIDLSMVK